MPSRKRDIGESVDVFLWLLLPLRLSYQSLTLIVGSLWVYSGLRSSLYFLCFLDLECSNWEIEFCASASHVPVVIASHYEARTEQV